MVTPVLPDGDGCLASVSSTVLFESLYLISFLSGATVINGLISLPVALLAYFFLPDTPGTIKPNWLFTERVSINYDTEVGERRLSPCLVI
jgi:hypothetical protein